MSGGFFSYYQYQIHNMAESLELEIEKSMLPHKPEQCSERGDPSNSFEPYPKEILELFRETADLLFLTEILFHRADWLLSGDDGNESYIKRLGKELDEFKGRKALSSNGKRISDIFLKKLAKIPRESISSPVNGQ